MTEIPDKIKKLLQSSDNENYMLGMAALREIHPSMWCALMNYSGFGLITESLLLYMNDSKHFLNLGHQVKYKGLPESPIMVVTFIGVGPAEKKSNSNTTYSVGGTGVPTYATVVTAKYWNKSNQSFVTVTDRLECFEIITK